MQVRNYIKYRCPTCAFNKVGARHGAMHVPIKGGRPWEIVCVDIVFLERTASGNVEAVVFIDRLGRGVRCFPVPRDVDSEMFLCIVAFGLIPDVGMPRVMISDRGSNIISELCAAFYAAYGMTPVLADAEMHTAVGTCERFNLSLIHI